MWALALNPFGPQKQSQQPLPHGWIAHPQTPREIFTTRSDPTLDTRDPDNHPPVLTTTMAVEKSGMPNFSYEFYEFYGRELRTNG